MNNEEMLEAAKEIERLREELEIERMRLAACGAVALANTPETAKQARHMQDNYRSASLDDVIRAVDAEMELRAENQRLREIEKTAREFVSDSYRPYPKHDAERFDRLSLALGMPLQQGD